MRILQEFLLEYQLVFFSVPPSSHGKKKNNMQAVFIIAALLIAVVVIDHIRFVWRNNKEIEELERRRIKI